MDWVKPWAVVNLFLLVPLVLTPWLAARRGRSAPFWGMIALFSSWFGFAALAFTTGVFGRGRPIVTKDIEPPDLRSPETRLAAAPDRFEPGRPTLRTLGLLLAGVATFSAIAAATASDPDQPDPRLDVATWGEHQAGINAMQLVTQLTREHDDLTFEQFVRNRVARSCGGTAAGDAFLTPFLTTRSEGEIYWVISVTVPEPSRCDELGMDRFSRLGLAGVYSTDARIVPVDAAGHPVEERYQRGSYLGDFRTGERP